MKLSSLRSVTRAWLLPSALLVACGGGADDDAGSGGTPGSGGAPSSGGSSSTGGTASSTGGTTSEDVCPAPVVVTWTHGGAEHHASTVFASIVGDAFGFNAVACEDDDQVVFKFLPFPLATGTYELRYHLLGETGPVEPAAQYATNDEGDYATNTDHTGELVITEVDAEAKTFSGTFHYDAIDALAGDENVDTVSVTNGVLTNVPYE